MRRFASFASFPLPSPSLPALSDQKVKIEKYNEELKAALASGSAERSKAFVEHSKPCCRRGARVCRLTRVPPQCSWTATLLSYQGSSSACLQRK